MTQAIDFKIAFLERIGVPLLSSIVSSIGGANDDGAKPERSEAQQIASLLGKSVELSSKLSDLLDLKQAGDKAESVRIALAAVSANLIANYQNMTGKAPDEAALKRLISAMETSLIFSDNFAPSEDHIARLGSIEIDSISVQDAHQINVQYMNIMVPVVLVVADYTFGRDEKKLIIEVSDKLSQVAARAAKSSDIDDALALKKQELQVLRAAVSVYTECHRAETKRIMDMTDDERAKLSEESGNFLSMDNLWHNFSNRFAMLEMLVGLSQNNAEFGGVSVQSVASVGPQNSSAEVVAGQNPVQPIAHKVEEQKQQVEPVAQTPAAENDNPMSFFSKKRASGNADGENADETMV